MYWRATHVYTVSTLSADTSTVSYALETSHYGMQLCSGEKRYGCIHISVRCVYRELGNNEAAGNGARRVNWPGDYTPRCVFGSHAMPRPQHRPESYEYYRREDRHGSFYSSLLRISMLHGRTDGEGSDARFDDASRACSLPNFYGKPIRNFPFLTRFFPSGWDRSLPSSFAKSFGSARKGRIVSIRRKEGGNNGNNNRGGRKESAWTMENYSNSIRKYRYRCALQIRKYKSAPLSLFLIVLGSK